MESLQFNIKMSLKINKHILSFSTYLTVLSAVFYTTQATKTSTTSTTNQSRNSNNIQIEVHKNFENNLSDDNFLRSPPPIPHINERIPFNEKYNKIGENFLLIDFLPDGEMERRISYDGLTAKETSAGNGSKSLKLWQFSNGKSFYQMIYSNNYDLLDCEYVRKRPMVKNFFEKFYSEVNAARSRNFTSPYFVLNNMKSHVSDREFREFIEYGIITPEMEEYKQNLDEISEIPTTDPFGMRNLTYIPLYSLDEIPENLRNLMNYKELKSQCDSRHREIKELVRGMNSQHEHERIEAKDKIIRKKRQVTKMSDFLLLPHTKWCGNGRNTEDYNQLGGSYKLDLCCRRHDHCRFFIDALTSKWDYFNFSPFTISHCTCDRRKRRDIYDVIRFPGTKWCGKGYTAERYSDMGGYSKADRCCRQHDKACPFWIPGFETKYGLFNWRVGSIMHCNCDERFRTCLKMADCTDANMVGKLFFNIVQTKCFVLKREKFCKKHKWWRPECEKIGYRKRAHLRDNRPY